MGKLEGLAHTQLLTRIGTNTIGLYDGVMAWRVGQMKLHEI